MKLCAAPNCKKKHYALGYCRAHHINFKRNGDPLPKYDVSGLPRGALGMTKDPKGRGSLEVNVINDLKYKARQRGKHWGLSHPEALALIIDPCTYCSRPSGWPTTRNGIDRLDNAIDYYPDNCISCCVDCNTAKMGRSVEEFFIWVENVYNRLKTLKGE